MKNEIIRLSLPPLPEDGVTTDWLTVIPVIDEPTVMKLQPEWFKMGYYVYVVVIKYKQENYFYVGMTGDRNSHTARSPFYRMSGHFTLTDSSTQNQIIKGINTKFGITENLDKALQEMQITYYAWLTNEYTGHDKNVHRLKRICAEKIESCLIEKMKSHYPGKVFNDAISNTDFCEVEPLAEQILKNLKQKVNE